MKEMTAEKTRKDSVIPRIRDRLLFLLTKYLVLVSVLLLVNQYLVTVRVVRGEDMYPRLRDSDILLVLRAKQIRRSGDVIVYRKDGRTFTGRIAAVPSDIISFSEEGDLLVNGSPVWQDVFYPTCAAEEESRKPLVLSEDAYFVLGDRRTQAQDSRILGPVTEKEIIGEVFWILRHRGI